MFQRATKRDGEEGGKIRLLKVYINFSSVQLSLTFLLAVLFMEKEGNRVKSEVNG